MVNKSTDLACDHVKLKVNDDDQEKHEGTVLPVKRTWCPLQRHKKDFNGRFMKSDCLKF
jgi:hypothetical protein